MLRKLIKILIKVVLILVAAVVVVAVATAIIDHANSIMHGELEWAESPDGDEGYLIYHGNSYYPSNRWLRSNLQETDVQIGWQYGFPFPNFYYYTDGTEAPLYIYSDNGGISREIFVRSDYDFKKQTYFVERTDIEFVFEEAFIQTENNTGSHNKISDVSVLLFLKDEPRLDICIFLCQADDGTWFFIKSGERYVLSDDFVSALKQNNIID